MHTATHAAALVDGYKFAFLVGAGLMATAIVVIIALIRRQHVATITADEPVLATR